MADSTEFLALMAGLDDDERAGLLARHLQAHGSTSMTESLRPLVSQAERLETDTASDVWDGLPAGVVEAFTDGNEAHRNLVIGVWNSWVDVVNAASAAGAVPGSGTASRASSAPVTAPTAATTAATGGYVSADSSSRCPSCGVASVGLCNSCENKEILDDHIEYDRRLYEIDQDRIEHDRLRDDRTHYDTSPSYDTSYDSYDSYDEY